MRLHYEGPDMFAGMQVRIVDAQQQARTPRDILGEMVRPRTPSKRAGRRGTRRNWKRTHPPHRVLYYREPTDVLVIQNRLIIATPAQADQLRRETRARP